MFSADGILKWNRLFNLLKNDSGSIRFLEDLTDVLEKQEDEIEKTPDKNKNDDPKDNNIPEDFSEVVQKYGSFVYNIARQSTRSDAEADDIAQEVFIKAWRSISSFRGDSSLSTWIGRIAINTCMDFARKRKRKATVSLTSFNDDESDGFSLQGQYKEFDIPDNDVSSDPEASAEKSEKIEIVRKAIASLSEEQRVVIVLRDMEGYSYSEISEMLELELGTVKSRINRARQNIKEYLISRNILG